MLKKLYQVIYKNAHAILFSTILLLYILLIKPSFLYFYQSIAEHYDLLFLIMVGVILYQVIKSKITIIFPVNIKFYLHFWNIFIFLLLAFCYPFVNRYLHVNLLSTLIGLLGIFVLSSFIIPFALWKKSIIPFILLLLCLPFGRQIDTYIGFPLRMLSVDFVSTQMYWLGIKSVAKETILVIENRASQVDIDCSGIKGIWTACIYYFTYSWVNNFKINFKWFLVLLTLITSVLFFNLIRVSILVLLNSTENYANLATLFHYSISSFGIVLSCILAHFLSLHFKLASKTQAIVSTKTFTFKNLKPSYSLVFTVFLLTLISFIPKQYVKHCIPTILPKMQSNNLFFIEPISFSVAERIVFERDQSKAQKFKFTYKKIKGEAILVKGTDWRAQHKPELCFEAAGNTIKSISTFMVDPIFPAKQLLFENTEANVFSWFQSPSLITDDYATRNWKELSGKESNWVLINIVISSNENEKNELIELLTHFKSEIYKSFNQTI